MGNADQCAQSWAREEFGWVDAGDARRRSRVIKMAAVAAASPAGTVAATYQNGAERQAAYDFLESKRTSTAALLGSISIACVERCRGERYVFVPIDGSSVAIVDRADTKGLGAIGSFKSGGRGLKVLTAIAVSPDGASLGICAQRFWCRSTLARERGGSKYRPLNERESHHVVDTIGDVQQAFAESDVSPVCVIDREGDATEILHALTSRRMLFIVRSSWDRRLATNPKTYLRASLERKPVLTSYTLAVPAGFRRPARSATMDVRVGRFELDLKHDWRAQRGNVSPNVVWAKERNPPPGVTPLHWILLTNLPVATPQDAVGIVTGYSRRWRIEEFHKTWKSGTCKVEDMQLRSAAAAAKWATLLAAVAIRIERLKQLARTEPDLPASVDLTPVEIKALILLKRMNKKKTETITDKMPTIAQAVLWIAELGSYTGKSSGGPPGSITISRGMERLLVAAAVLEFQRESRKKR